MKRVTAILLGAATLVACTASAESADRGARKPIPEARETGKAVSCIPITQIRESRVRSDQIIDFRTSGNKWYRNTLPSSCPSLGFEERFSYKTSISQLCSTDIITVLQSGGPGLMAGASCGLGQFQPVELARKAK